VWFVKDDPRFDRPTVRPLHQSDTTNLRGIPLDQLRSLYTPVCTSYLDTATYTHRPLQTFLSEQDQRIVGNMSIPESTRKEHQEPENMTYLSALHHQSPEKHEKTDQKGALGKSGGGNSPSASLMLEIVLSLTSPEFQNAKLHEASNVEASILARSALIRRAPDRLTSLLPPDNFGAVIPGSVYRSSFPLPENFSFLRSLKLKTILTLVPKPFPDAYVEFLETNGIRQIVVPIAANKDVVCIEDTTMIQALGVVLDRSHYPLLIHCNKGKHRTGCTVACLRKIQGEGMRAALQEYHTYAGSKARSLDETFIRSFDERSLLWLAMENGLLYPDEPAIESPSLLPGMLARPRG
jgi:tyrosine-protein phosphatase SIW14